LTNDELLPNEFAENKHDRHLNQHDSLQYIPITLFSVQLKDVGKLPLNQLKPLRGLVDYLELDNIHEMDLLKLGMMKYYQNPAHTIMFCLALNKTCFFKIRTMPD
jgi:hypothetical protein